MSTIRNPFNDRLIAEAVLAEANRKRPHLCNGERAPVGRLARAYLDTPFYLSDREQRALVEFLSTLDKAQAPADVLTLLNSMSHASGMEMRTEEERRAWETENRDLGQKLSVADTKLLPKLCDALCAVRSQA